MKEKSEGMNNKKALQKLNELFGSYRAEWLRGKIFELFAEPSYFAALQDNRPCVLEGGRGTGKTTVLRGLSYQGQFALHGDDINKFDNSNFIGIYHRVNTNHVRAFIGGDLDTAMWMKVFGHYFNLIICREILIFLKWHNKMSSHNETLSQHVCNLIAKSIHINIICENINDLLINIDIKMYEFQAQVNNIGDSILPNLSMAGDPIKIITEHVMDLPQFKDKVFFILLDEYENYEDYQQQLLNTLIKHNSEYYTFKIGVRELGWRIKYTLNLAELLHDPADYVLVNIEKEWSRKSLFSDFAKSVCQQRITQLIPENDDGSSFDIEKALGNLSNEEEADILEVVNTDYVKSYTLLPDRYKNIIDGLDNLYKYFIAYWANWHKTQLADAIDDYISNRKSWDTRYENNKYEMLFKIRKGRGKSGIQKYYTGWNTYLKLANGNIRYLMELVYRAYEKHLDNEEKIRSEVSCKNQTLAAQDIGQKNLMELEGLWKNGAQITKLLLGFGRIFQLFASTEGKFAPEKNQFSIVNSEGISKECKDLLTASVMNLALVRTPGNKLSDDSHTRDYDYTIHPIYSAFFVFSYRKKRKITIKQEEILGLVSNPKENIRLILSKSKIINLTEDELPVQLDFFENYYK